MDLISSDTGITVGLVITLIGGVVWLTRLHSLALTNQRTLIELNKRIAVQDARIESQEREAAVLTNQISIINTKLDYIIDELKKHH